jgi:hypothetical protein
MSAPIDVIPPRTSTGQMPERSPQITPKKMKIKFV